MRRHSCFLGVLCVAALAAATGCRGGKAVPVKGVVTLDGQLMSGVMVSFVPTDQSGKLIEGGRPATGVTDDQGRFQLTTFRTNDGAMPGDYRVTVVREQAPATSTEPDTVEGGAVHNRAMGRNISKSPTGKAQEAAERKKLPASPIPAVYKDPARTPLREVVPADGDVVLALKSDAK
jgi:hypothetical protein